MRASEALSCDSSLRNAGVGCAVKSGQVGKATPERAAGGFIHLPHLKRASSDGAAGASQSPASSAVKSSSFSFDYAQMFSVACVMLIGVAVPASSSASAKAAAGGNRVLQLPPISSRLEGFTETRTDAEKKLFLAPTLTGCDTKTSRQGRALHGVIVFSASRGRESSLNYTAR